MRAFVRMSVVLSLASAAARSARAQAVGGDTIPRSRLLGERCNVGQVGGGPACPAERRVAIDVRGVGVGAPPRTDLQMAVATGAELAGLDYLPLESAAAVDSAVHGVLTVERGAGGAFRLATRVAGAAARPGQGVGCESEATGMASDVALGAQVAAEAAQLARCIQRQRRAAAR